MIFFLLIIIFFLPSTAMAGSFHAETTLLSQIRKESTGERESPSSGYVGLAFDTQPLSAETDLRVFRDFSQRLDDFDLYQAVFHIKPAEHLQLDLGRQFVSQGFFAETIDGIQIILSPIGVPIILTGYSGFMRTVEVGDFKEDEGFLTGFSIGATGTPNTDAQLHLAWRKNDLDWKYRRQNDELFLGINLSHQFSMKTSPLIYGLFEYDLVELLVNSGTLGLDISPKERLSVNAELNYFNINRSGRRQTILSLFTRGPTLSGRLSSTLTFIEDLLDFIEGYSVQREEIQDGVWRYGHLLDAGFRISFDKIGLFLEPTYYLRNSFGGSLHGGRLSLHEQFTDWLYATAVADYAKYTKITNDDDYAFSSSLWGGVEILKGWTLSGGFEYNKNTLFDRDIRGSIKIDYVFDRS